jgi:hypothetical protein
MNKKLRFYLPCDQSMCYLKALHMLGSLTHTQKALIQRASDITENNNVDNRINIHSILFSLIIYRPKKGALRKENSIKRISTYDERSMGGFTNRHRSKTNTLHAAQEKKKLLWTLIQLIM